MPVPGRCLGLAMQVVGNTLNQRVIAEGDPARAVFAAVHPQLVCFTDADSSAETPVCYLHYVMERCYVKSWSTSTSGDADDRPTEEVAFYFNKIAFGTEGNATEHGMHWDNVKNKPWSEGLDWLFDFGAR